MHQFNEIQMQLLAAMLEKDILLTYKFVKVKIKLSKKSKSWIWESISQLEKLGLIERINDTSCRKIKHKKLFDKKLLKEKYNMQFDIQNATLVTIEVKETVTLNDIKEIFQNLKK